MSIKTPLVALVTALAAATTTPAYADPVNDRPPIIDVGVRGTAFTVSGHEQAAPGFVRVRFSARGTGESYGLALIELKPGRTAADVDDLQLAGLQDASRIEPVGRLVAGATLDHPQDKYVTRIQMRDRRYVAVDVGHEDQQSRSFRPGGSGEPARRGRHDAAIVVRDDGITAPDVLPRKGLIRISNRGDDPHALVALRLRRGLSTAEAARRTRAGARPDELGRRFDLLGVVSGHTANEVEAELPTGRYLLVSYYGALRGADSDLARGLITGVRVE